MKIVRLAESKGATAYFDNIFNDEIELPPFSEVALASVSINVDPEVLTVSYPSTLSWKRDQDSEIGTSLRPTTYTRDNHPALLFDIEGNLNYWQAASDGNDAGRQWAVSDDPDVTDFGTEGKVSIGYQTANYEGGAKEAFQHTNVTETGTGLAATYKKTAGGDSVLLSTEPLGWGNSRFYANMETITNSGGAVEAQGIYMGLSTIDHIAARSLPAIDDDNTLMAIHIPHTGTKALLYGGAIEYNADDDEGTDIAAGQLYGFETQKRTLDVNTVNAVRYLANGNKEYLGTDDGELFDAYPQLEFGELGSINAKKPLYPFIIFIGSSTHSIANEIQLSPDPYSIIATKKYKVITKTNGTRGLQNNESKPILNFDFGKSLSIGNFLGFTNSKMKSMTIDISATNATKFAWTADQLFNQGIKGQGFYVELMTGTCEGYDGQTGQRKNILAVIPESDSDDKILFQPSFPMFLEMNNSHPLVLRNIRARLLQTDGSAVEVDGMNSMTLLFKPGKSQ